MKVAIVHYWLVSMRGGERVLESLCELFPQADLFTHVYAPDTTSPIIRAHRITASFINKLPRAKTLYKSYLPLMPLALEQFDLRGYDLIISSESGPSKGVIPPPTARHICYCHSPMRYIWNMAHEYREQTGFLKKRMIPPLAHYLRLWDASAAQRVDRFVANSHNVARRIELYYRRPANVIHPPVHTEAFRPGKSEDVGEFYLMVGELVRYKRPELAVDVFNRWGRPLVVVGGGEMLGELRRMAASHVKIVGPQPFEELRRLYATCRALVFPGEEDFGIVPVEAMASGRPVIAFNRGGALETVVDGVTGVMFDEQTPDALRDACLRLENTTFDSKVIAGHAAYFNSERFKIGFMAQVDAEMAQREQITTPARIAAAYSALKAASSDGPYRS